MRESILDSIKVSLGLQIEDASFDTEILLHLNGVFASLNELGIGPEDGFVVATSQTIWADFYGDENRLNHIRSYVYLRVRMLFDPPTTAHAIGAFEKQIEKFEWLLTTTSDEIKNPPKPEPPVVVLN